MTAVDAAKRTARNREKKVKRKAREKAKKLALGQELNRAGQMTPGQSPDGGGEGCGAE
jgi:hypothetical protein